MPFGGVMPACCVAGKRSASAGYLFVGPISPADPSGPYGTTIAFSASASGPLTWSVSGAGSIDASTGVFTPGFGDATITAELASDPSYFSDTSFSISDMFADDFNGTSGTALTAHSPDVGGGPWLTAQLAMELDGSSNAQASTTGGGHGNVIDFGSATGIYRQRVTLPAGDNYSVGMLLRWIDSDNWRTLVVQRDGGGTPYCYLARNQAGSFTIVYGPQNLTGDPTGATIWMEVEMTSGNHFIFSIKSDDLATTYHSADHAGTSFASSATKHGISNYRDGTYQAVPIHAFFRSA